jgi:hypothetical protein
VGEGRILGYGTPMHGLGNRRKTTTNFVYILESLKIVFIVYFL